MRLRGALMGGALTVGLLACAASTAAAASDPGWFDSKSAEERQAIVDYVYQRSGHEPPHPGQAETTAAAIEGSVVQAGADGVPLASDAGKIELIVATRVGLMTRLTTMVPTLWAVGGTFVAGYAIGWGGRKLFAKLTAPDDARTGGAPNWPWSSITWYPQGYDIFFGARVQQSPGAYLYDSNDGAGVIRWFEPPCSFSGFTPAAGARMQYGVPSTAACREWVRDVGPVDFPVFVDYPYLLESDVGPASPLRPTRAGDAVDRWEPFPPDPGPTAVTEGLDLLDEADFELLRSQADWALTPGAQPEEEPIRAGVDLTENDRACKTYYGETGQGDPGRRSPEADPLAPDWDYDVDAFPNVYNPLISSTQTVKLRWGDSIDGWGYRHIKHWHGWDAAARLRTALALADTAPTVDGLPTSFRYVANLPTGPSGVRCQQRVIVSYREDGKVPVGRHIITSFVDGVG
jgi:hypothetical protein